jgi:hypothetical protein
MIRPYRADDLTAATNRFGRSARTIGARFYDAEQGAVWAPEPPDTSAWSTRLSRGGGRELLEFTIEWAGEPSASATEADVSLAARRLFEASGFRVVRAQSRVRRVVAPGHLKMIRSKDESGTGA